MDALVSRIDPSWIQWINAQHSVWLPVVWSGCVVIGLAVWVVTSPISIRRPREFSVFAFVGFWGWVLAGTLMLVIGPIDSYSKFEVLYMWGCIMGCLCLFLTLPLMCVGVKTGVQYTRNSNLYKWMVR